MENATSSPLKNLPSEIVSTETTLRGLGFTHEDAIDIMNFLFEADTHLSATLSPVDT